ncbi:MAG: radical SAM family heme chaperone HemW [bacterium]
MAGLYIHVPFCLKKCAYCDFYSIPVSSTLADTYAEALLEEIQKILPESCQPEIIETIYFGGGTPSLLQPRQVGRILEETAKYFSLSGDCEITLEANPGTVNFENLKGFRAAGINRLSLGAQSFSDEELLLLGRLHLRRDILEATEAARRAGFDNFGLDLIFGIPGQSRKSWKESLIQALSLSPSHLSCYLLQMDESVPLARLIAEGSLNGLGGDEEADLYDATMETLTENGFSHYEIANFALPGRECRHNINYWTQGEYLGLGPGAVSFRNGSRYRNAPDVQTYIGSLSKGDSPPREELETMGERELAAEALMLGLRMTAGVDVEKFEDRFGVSVFERFGEAIRKGLEDGLLEYQKPILKFARKGLFLSNSIFREII